MEIERAELRKIQFLVVLLSCLPRGGKCREVLELALALDEEPQMARLAAAAAADDLGTNEGVRLWLESLWAREDLSPEEQEVVWWQNDGRNMDVAIRELKAVEARLGTTWTIAPSASYAVKPPVPDGDGESGTTAFHHASALQALLDLIEDGEGGDLQIDQREAGPHTVHHQRRNAAGVVTRVVQAVSVPQPSSIMSSDVWCAVRRWSGLDVSQAPQATFVIHTDGGLFPTAVVAVTDRLHRFSQGCATAEDVHVAKMVGVPPDGRLLRHVRLRCNAGPASALWPEVSWRVRRLLQAGSRGGEQDAGEVTERLLRRCAACSERGDVVTREEAASLAGVDVAALDGAGNWGPELASRYLLRLPAGAGEGIVPVSLELGHAVVAGLHSAIRRRVESVSGRYLTAAGARQLLASPNLLLQLEGAAERAGPGTLLWEEVRVAREANPSMRVTGPERRSGAPVGTQASG